MLTPESKRAAKEWRASQTHEEEMRAMAVRSVDSLCADLTAKLNRNRQGLEALKNQDSPYADAMRFYGDALERALAAITLTPTASEEITPEIRKAFHAARIAFDLWTSDEGKAYSDGTEKDEYDAALLNLLRVIRSGSRSSNEKPKVKRRDVLCDAVWNKNCGVQNEGASHNYAGKPVRWTKALVVKFSAIEVIDGKEGE